MSYALTHIEPDFSFLKEGSVLNVVKLSPQAQNWVNEVMQHLLEEHPYLAEYGLKGKVVASDPEKLYAIGYIEVRQAGSQFGRAIRVPFIIENQHLHPMRVFLDPKGRGDLLSRDLVERQLFDPSLTAGIGSPERDVDTFLLESLYPPDRYRHGSLPYRGVTTSKVSSALREAMEDSLLLKIAHTLSAGTIEAFMREMRESGAEVAMKHHGHWPLIEKLAEVAEATQQFQRFTGHTTSAVKTDALQIERIGPGLYRVKEASSEAYQPKSAIVPAREMRDLFGSDVVKEVDERGRVTVTTKQTVKQRLDNVRVEQIKDFGVWKVQTQDGDHLIGWVITEVLDYDMVLLPIKLFTNGREYAFQDDMAGVRVGKGLNLPRRIPQAKDFGCFYYISPHDANVVAFIPGTIAAIEELEDGKLYFAIATVHGDKVRVSLEPGLKSAVKVREGVYAIPEECSFLPLKKEIHLVGDAAHFSKLATAQLDELEGVLSGSLLYNGRFSGKGPLFEKLGERAWHLDEADMELLLVSSGLSLDDALEKMAQAVVYGSTEVRGRPVYSPEYRYEKIASIVEASLGHGMGSALRKNTIKIAASLPALARPQSVDAILSLNFINDANLGLFLDSLPTLEEARKDLAELFLAALVGLPEVSKEAIVSGMEALKEVADGLRKLKMRKAPGV